MAAAAEVQMERLKRGGLEDVAQGTERIPPRLRFLGSVSAREILQLGYEVGTVIFHAGAKLLDRDDHRFGR
jgi:hypothetical protein